MGRVFVGHDWAEAHHDVHVEDDQGRRLAKARVADGVGGVARFHELIATFAGEPDDVTIATETGRGLFVCGVGRCWVSGGGGEPDVDIAVSGAALDIGREVRPG